MKRILSVVVFLCLLCGCTQNTISSPEYSQTEVQNNELKGVWFTFSELDTMVKSEQGFSAAFSIAAENCKELGINNIFVHVRPFCDSVYESAYFPKRAGYENIDALKIMTDICKEKGIKIHAWINPYRVSTASSDIADLPEGSPARKYLSDQDTANDKCVSFTQNGIYLNPAESICRSLILQGVREILENYEVDGIHFDDYFYPTTSHEFDKASYDEYSLSVGEPLSVENWRRKNINTLLQAVYCAVKGKDKNAVFGISPAADLDRCYNSLYADIEGWIKGGYIDYIMPQLYFGFEYPKDEFKFENLALRWEDITEGKSVTKYCGLANYKIGTNAIPDSEEWNKDTDIIARQIKYLRDNNWSGFVFFSYSSLFSESELNSAQLEQIKKEMENK